MALCHGVSQYLRGAGVVFKLEQRIITEAAGTPEAETILPDQGGDVVLVQQSGISCRVLQIPEHIRRQAGYAVDAHVRQGFVPAGLLVDFSAQAKGAGGSVGGRIRLQHRVKVYEVRPDNHSFTLAEVVAVSDRLCHGFTAVS